MTILIGSIMSAILYRLGGMKGMNTKFRDFGCPLVFIGVMYVLNGFSWQMFLSAFLMFAALCTYWDSVFGKDNMFAHGFMIGLALIPMCWTGVHFWQVGLYAVVLGVTMGLLNVLCTKRKIPYSDYVEELSRGALIIIALKIL